MACSSGACTERDSTVQLVESGESARPSSEGSDAALDTVSAAIRAFAQRGATVDYVAAQMKGVIKVRKKSLALIHYEGYRASLATVGERVTRIDFDFVEAKPSVGQLNEMFGTPREVRRGMLYSHTSSLNDAKLSILAETKDNPAEEGTLVRRLVIEGARAR
jgi:hypothetical protein